MAELEKLKIIAYSDEKFSNQINTFEVQINPESYTRTFKAPETQFKKRSATGISFVEKIVYPPREKVTLNLIFDGTGVISNYDVAARIRDFKKLTLEYQGLSHATNYLKIIWGNWGDDMAFRCQLRDLTLKYTLFKPDGTPLRAEATAVFEEFWDAATRAKKDNKSSPDLSHYILVKAGDTLPLLAFRIYGESRFCVQVAAINKLPSIASIQPGQRLLFPPLKS